MVKQLLTLATGGVGAIIALFDNDKLPGVQLAGSWLLLATIALLVVSAVAGVITLGALTAELSRKNTTQSVNRRDIRKPAMVQMVAFGLAIVALAAEVMKLHWAWWLGIGIGLVAYAVMRWSLSRRSETKAKGAGADAKEPAT